MAASYRVIVFAILVVVIFTLLASSIGPSSVRPPPVVVPPNSVAAFDTNKSNANKNSSASLLPQHSQTMVRRSSQTLAVVNATSNTSSVVHNAAGVKKRGKLQRQQQQPQLLLLRLEQKQSRVVITPRPCHDFKAAGTIDMSRLIKRNFDLFLRRKFDFESGDTFDGSPLVKTRKIAAAAVPAWHDLAVRSYCQDYAPAAARTPPASPGCGRVSGGATNLAATRIFNVFDVAKSEAVIEASSDKNATTRCLLHERRAIMEGMRALEKANRMCLVRGYTNLAARKRAAGLLASDSVAASNSSSSSTATTAVPRAPSVGFKRRRRILVTACLRRHQPANTRKAPQLSSEDLMRNPARFRDMMRSFLTVAEAGTDELHILVDYSQNVWHLFAEGLMMQEARRKRRSIFLEQLARGKNATPRFVDDGTVSHSAKVIVHDVAGWSTMRRKPPPGEAPLSSRVWYINHMLRDGPFAREHDESIAMMMFADSRDVLFQTNPFTAILDLRLGRAHPGAPYAADEQEFGAFRGIAIGAEEVSHFCNIGLGKGNTPPWERGTLSAAANNLLLNTLDRLLPDGSTLPILCSGVIYGTIEAAREFFDVSISTILCRDTNAPFSMWGADQGSANIVPLIATSAARLNFDTYILAPSVAPIRHFHYFDNDLFPIFVGDRPASANYTQPHVYLNCAGRPLAVLHQLDRKELRYKMWKHKLDSEFEGM